MENKNVYYCSADGDNIGNIIGKSFLGNDIGMIKITAKKIELGGHIMRVFVMKHRGDVINIGGDEGVWAIPESALPDLERLRSDYHDATGFTLSIGVGMLPSEAAKALLVSKIRGKDQIAFYDKSVKKEIKKAKEKVKKHKASVTEQKLAEAGLLKAEESNQQDQECEYCKQTDGVDPDHCQHCHDMDDDCPYCAEASQSHEDDCPYCQETDDDCPYCQEDEAQDGEVEQTGGPQVQLPTTTSSQDYAGQDLSTPDLDKPDAISENPDGLAFNPDVQTNENRRLDEEAGKETGEEVAPQGQEDNESVQGVLDAIDSLPPTESQARQEKEQVDEADLAVGTNMEGNTSRPEGFESNAPGDLGLGEDGGEDAPKEGSTPEYEQHPENQESEEGPDISSVLQEGLDNHADSIQRERTIQLVAEALEGFKASKDILEKAKMQAPQLYESSIAMLKAMIEMAKMLGLEGAAQEQTPEQGEGPEYEQHPDNGLGEGSAQGEETPEYESHPDNAAAKEGAASKPPKKQGQLANQ